MTHYSDEHILDKTPYYYHKEQKLMSQSRREYKQYIDNDDIIKSEVRIRRFGRGEIEI